MKKECVTMLLAGGIGKRLGQLTKNVAKPAVPFGGRYRIIDFTLSNCVQSKMYTVGVLTQYQPLTLHKHIGIGKSWDLDRMDDGLTILSPFTEHDGGKWYEGTADAVAKNIRFIERYDPDYVLILSGDHIYHMDYNELLHHHKSVNADVTISVIQVPWEETSRFGIVNMNNRYQITSFEEKPLSAKSNLASMGIYIFKWDVLKDFLQYDHNNPDSTHDFGKDILPYMLHKKRKLYAYPFSGYWKDVGTVQSYWEAHMDLLDDHFLLQLNKKNWITYSHDNNFAPQLIASTGSVNQSLINNGCVISGSVEASVLFEDVQIGIHTIVKNSILHPGVRVGHHVILERVIVQEGVNVPDFTTVSVPLSEEPVVLTNEYFQEIQKVGGLNR
ncbi:glucose-1-phosphate adenylyltransferase [Gracilibacillus ureilyticus]|uniref:Glucose-1-phosphate adenylyltransferase n=1 Tax=Gracilibacillus ureilyticus TaxID=531814 RepID=A0A1H9LJT8_9BACI|nr:glucose-1-phosphate adenylyltransferase [Gracilibacillus ureilyticus]SER11385.1 glucose-1-phosphate adenylyltransferase [Gracilibacillus ureilyticus]